MAIRTAPTEHEIFFVSSRTTTALYLAEFRRLFEETRKEIEKQHQGQLALARSFFELAAWRFKTIPSQAEIAKLLLECMRNHSQVDKSEPAVLTMEIATALTAFATHATPQPQISNETHAFLTEAGILPLDPRSTWWRRRTPAAEGYVKASQLR